MVETTRLTSYVRATATVALLVCFLASNATAADINFPLEDCTEPNPDDCPTLDAVMGSAEAGDTIIITTEGPHVMKFTVNWQRAITVRAAAGVNPIIRSLSTEFLQPFAASAGDPVGHPGAHGSQFGDNDFGTIILDAQGDREFPHPDDPEGPNLGNMRNLIDLKHGPGPDPENPVPIVFENLRIINPGSDPNNAVPGTGIRAVITQHNEEEGASYIFNNCRVEFGSSFTNSVLADQDSSHIQLIDCVFLADGVSTFPMIRLDGFTEAKEGPPVIPPFKLDMTLEIVNCRIEGINSTVDLMNGEDMTVAISNSCLRSTPNTMANSDRVLAAVQGGPVTTDVDITDSILTTGGSDFVDIAAVDLRGSAAHDLNMDHCDVSSPNGDGVRFGLEDGIAVVTNSNVTVGLGTGFRAPAIGIADLTADFNNVFTDGGTDYDVLWVATNDVGAGDPLYTDINNCDASYLNGALGTADSAGAPVGSDGPGMIAMNLQLPGDCNQDGVLDLSDAVCLLGHLFQGNPADLPCSTDAANLSLMDCNEDGGIDLSDVIYKLAFLFQGGNPPLAGTACTSMANCPTISGCP